MCTTHRIIYHCGHPKFQHTHECSGIECTNPATCPVITTLDQCCPNCRSSTTNGGKEAEQPVREMNKGKNLVHGFGDMNMKEEEASSEDLGQSGYLGDDEDSECGCVGCEVKSAVQDEKPGQ